MQRVLNSALLRLYPRKSLKFWFLHIDSTIKPPPGQITTAAAPMFSSIEIAVLGYRAAAHSN